MAQWKTRARHDLWGRIRTIGNRRSSQGKLAKALNDAAMDYRGALLYVALHASEHRFLVFFFGRIRTGSSSGAAAINDNDLVLDTVSKYTALAALC